MKAYVHDPAIFRQHYLNQSGQGLPGFRGQRMQYGRGIGSFLGKLVRKAIPLLASGAKMVAPHLKKAAVSIATDVGGKAMQAVTRKITGSKKPVKRRKRAKVVSKRRKVKASTSKDIF